MFTYACSCLLLLIILTHCIHICAVCWSAQCLLVCKEMLIFAQLNYLCLPLFTNHVYHENLFAHFTCVCPEICLPEYIFLCLPVFTMLVCACICSLHTFAHFYLFHLCISLCLPMKKSVYTHVYPSFPVFTHVYPCLPVFTHV